MRILKRLVRWIGLVIKDEPIRTWRKLDNGKYICDGDCGRWTLHGICTCGLCHYYKPIEGGHDQIERDNESWHREYQTEDIMRRMPYENECPHGLSWNNECNRCQVEIQAAIGAFLKEWNNENNTTTC